MEYEKFKNLIAKGENQTTDFKIKSLAFSKGGVSTLGELAKDICAMANNGNRSSYIIIGVSDDGSQFRSVDNDNLTDDNLQDFCKKAIFPPPKVSLVRRRWKKGKSNHRNKEFVIIQIGPNKTEIFRLARDFIDYKSRVCFRRHEVWIRRNAISDLATPEEIIHRSKKGSYTLDEEDQKLQAERSKFASLSFYEKGKLIGNVAERTLSILGYSLLEEPEWFNAWRLGASIVSIPTFWKKVGTQAILVCLVACQNSLTKKTLEKFNWVNSDLYSRYIVQWDDVPSTIKILTRRRVKSLRRISLIPVLRSVPTSRVEDVFPGSRKSANRMHFYNPRLGMEQYRWRLGNAKPIASSSELLVIDRINSGLEFSDRLTLLFSDIEQMQSSLVNPQELKRI